MWHNGKAQTPKRGARTLNSNDLDMEKCIWYFSEQIVINFRNTEEAKASTRVWVPVTAHAAHPKAAPSSSQADIEIAAGAVIELQLKEHGEVDVEQLFYALHRTTDPAVHTIYKHYLQEQLSGTLGESASYANAMYELLRILCEALTRARHEIAPEAFDTLKPHGL